nr:MAG TPA: hypothetical protein [Caudoviricetes sp.]
MSAERRHAGKLSWIMGRDESPAGAGDRLRRDEP